MATDLDRLEKEYARRAADPRYREWYSPLNPGNMFVAEERDREIARALAQHTHIQGGECRALDVGCGEGAELAKLTRYGAQAGCLFGIELLPDRIQRAKERFPDLAFTRGNAADLPYADASFDLVLQFTVFTSILDDALRRRMAQEMRRVLKRNGLILWYDYIFNPTNPQTRGIAKPEIRRLFPGCAIRFRRITLAPPLARRLAPRARFACALLSRIPFLRTHYLALIQNETR